MKKILALAAVAALTAGVSAFAANPFSDVSPDDWAYQAISDLSDQGVVEGYPDGTFKGERNITRYEAAQIIARLLAKEDQLNAEQRATLDKLAGEYSDELSNLGVRVGNLEKKVGNISWAGDARMRYQSKSHSKNGGRAPQDGSWNGRMRLKIKGQVNDSTYVYGQLNNTMNFKSDSDDDNKTYMDYLYVHHQFGDNTYAEVGRIYWGLGYNDELYGDSFDGIKVNYTNKAFFAEAGFGRMQAVGRDGYDNIVNGDSSEQTAYGKIGYNDGTYGLTANYVKINNAKGAAINGNNANHKAENLQFWGFDGNIGFAKAWKVYGSYYKETEQHNDPTYWFAGLQYGQMNWKKPGTFNAGIQYNHNDYGAVLGPVGPWQTNAYWIGARNKDDITYWSVNTDITLQKNVALHAEYAFDIDGDKYDYSDAYTVTLNYKF